MFKVTQKVETVPFEGGHVVLRELTARQLQSLQSKFGDEANGLDFAAALVVESVLEPRFETVEDAREALSDLPMRCIDDLVREIMRVSSMPTREEREGN